MHGGAWGSGDRLNNAVIHEDLAANGVGVFALDFRLSDAAQYPDPAGRLLRRPLVQGQPRHARHRRREDRRAGLILGRAAARARRIPPGWPRLGPRRAGAGRRGFILDFFVAGWPIFDPLRRYRMVQDAGNERLVAAHDAYFAAEADMETGNPYRLLDRNEATHTPPMLIVQGTNDANVDHAWQDEFVALYRFRGGTADILKFEGQPHTFVTAEPEAEASQAAIAAVREFVLGV